MEGIPKPTSSRVPLERRLRKIDLLAEEEEGVPLPTRQPQAFRLARPTDWVKLKREVLGQEEFVAERHDLDGLQVDDDDHGATFVSHSEWERRLAAAQSRRQTEQEEHSTGILGTIKGWATSLWGKVKMALWG